MRTAILLAAVSLLVFSNGLHAQVKVEIDPKGTTNQMNAANFKFKLTNPGKLTLDAKNPIQEVKLAGAFIPAADRASNVNKGGLSGDVTIIKPNVPKGKRSVELTVLLSNGTKVTGKQDVDFQVILFGPWLAAPILLTLRLKRRQGQAPENAM